MISKMSSFALLRSSFGCSRFPIARPRDVLFRTHVSRAAKKVTEPVKPVEKASVESADAARSSRASKLFPRFLRTYAERVTKAPFSHITSFLILHELSAIVPLFGVWGLFYYFDYYPLGLFPDWVIQKGSGFIRRMAERNDWQFVLNATTGSKLVLQGAAAYAIVKASLPVRLVFSVWAMPWFARWFVIPINKRLAAGLHRLRQKPAK